MSEAPANFPRARSSAALPLGAHRMVTPDGALDLMPDGSVFDPVTRTLLVADVHVGKAEVFRRLGVPVPAMTSRQTLNRLTASIAACQPQRLITLGDLVHGRLPAAHPVFDELTAWREQHQSVSVHLLRGNHDHRAGDPPARCKIEIWPAGERLGSWQLCHEPDEVIAGAGMGLCGHVHPVVRLRQGPDALRVRCFWRQENHVLVLPAFGAFTGGYAISPSDTDQVFVLDGQGVRRLPDGWATRQRVKRRAKHTRSG